MLIQTPHRHTSTDNLSPASANPALHVRRVNGDGMFNKYLGSFDAVWDNASPWQPDTTPEQP